MWIFATRSRPDNCQRFIDAWIKTKASTPVYLRIDDCDPFLEDLKKLNWPKEFTVNIGPREGLRAAIEEGFHKFPNEPWYGFLADDLLPQTEHWDLKIIERAGNNSVAYPNDLGGKPRCPTHPIIGGDLVRAVGWFGLPNTKHLYLDAAWQVIGEGLGKIYRLDTVIVEHIHPLWRKANKDATYVQAKKMASGDKAEFFRWRDQESGKLLSDLKLKGF